MLGPMFERWGLNPREQRVATFGVYLLGLLVVLALPVGLSMMVSSRHAENDELKETLAMVNGARAKIRTQQDRKSAIASRYAKKAPQLGGFLEQKASAAGCQVQDSVDRPDVNHGKAYVERQTTIHLKNVGLGPIARFLESLEKAEVPIAVTRLNIRKRAGENDSYGPVEIGVSAFDRNATSSSSGASPAGSSSAGGKK